MKMAATLSAAGVAAAEGAGESESSRYHRKAESVTSWRQRQLAA